MKTENSASASASAVAQSMAMHAQDPVAVATKKFLEIPLKKAMEMIVNNAKLTSAKSVNSQDPNELGNAMEKAKDSLPVDIYTVMALFQRMAQEMRNVNREMRASALDSQVGELLNAANDMKKSADFKLAAALVQSGIQMAGGVIQLGGAYASGKEAAASARAQNKADYFKDMSESFSKDSEFRGYAADEAKQFSGDALKHSNQANKIDRNVKTVNEFGSNIGSVINAGLSYAASRAEVDAKKHEAAAKLHEAGFAQANDMMQQMMDVIRDVREKVSAMDQSRIETNRSISRNI